MEDTKVQWHPGFVAAMNLDIVEYKSPEDHLDIDVFYKTMAYAALYKSYGKTLDAIRADDVTVTLIREAKPKGLIRYLKEHNYKLINQYKGIYYVMGNVLFPVQIVVTGELDLEEHIWISSLSQKMKKQDMQELFQRIQTLQSRLERELGDSVLLVRMGADGGKMERRRSYVSGFIRDYGTRNSYHRKRKRRGRLAERHGKRNTAGNAAGNAAGDAARYSGSDRHA